MLHPGQPASIYRPNKSGRSTTLGAVQALAQAVIAAVEAAEIGEIEEYPLSPRDAGNAGAVRRSRDPGPISYLAALTIAVALVFVWVGLRSL